jgi:hypothetical protein
MKKNTLSAEGFESTYALLVRSEDKERGIFEGAVYLVFLLSAIFSIWQVAHQPIVVPTTIAVQTASVAQPADTNQRA